MSSDLSSTIKDNQGRGKSGLTAFCPHCKAVTNLSVSILHRIENSPQRYYAIEYARKKGEHPKRGEFSPDFFIKLGDMIHVVEIKGDEEITDPSTENIKKNEYALDHFDRLNEWLKGERVSVRYQLNFLSPKNYNIFFQHLRKSELEGFRSELDVALRRDSDDD